jgi:hypothetical protein
VRVHGANEHPPGPSCNADWRARKLASAANWPQDFGEDDNRPRRAIKR